jgi:hypothetical protein
MNGIMQAFKEEDMDGVGRCIAHCWSLKKKMATGCEPEFVGRYGMIESLEVDH